MGPFHPYPPPRPAPTAPAETKAVLSLVLGILSMGCAGPVAGVPAIILGSIARRDIDRSNGALGGRALAAGGIVSGLFGTGIGLVLALSVVGALVSPDDDAANASQALPPAVTASAMPSEEAPSPVASPTPAATLSGTRSYGSLAVVDLDESRPLHAQLAEITAHAGGRTVVLQTYARSSAACDAIAMALPDKRMQRALANVTLVRVDVDEYELELHRMKIETSTAPWFYRLDAKGAPTDAISAVTWDTNVPETMAPVLGRFVRTPATPGSRRR